MAVVNTGYAHHEKYLAFADETTYGTAIADTVAFTKFDLLNQAPSFQPGKSNDSRMRARGRTTKDVEDYNATSNGVLQAIQTGDFIAPADVLAKMIYATLQSVSEAASTPFNKTFTVNGQADPDFSSNAGYFYSMLGAHAIGSDSYKLTSCVNNTLTINFSSAENGRVIANASALSGKGYSLTANPTGNNEFSAVVEPNFHTSTRTLTINSLDLVWTSAVFTLETQYGPIGNDGSGGFNNLKVSDQMVRATFTVKYDTNSDAFKTADSTGATDLNATTFTIGSSSAAGYFYFNSPHSILTNVTHNGGDANTPQFLVLEFEFPADHSASEYPSFQIADGVDQSW